MPEMSKAEEAAFAAMQQETTGPATPPAEPAEAEALEDAEAQPEPAEGETETEGAGEAARRPKPAFVPHAALNEERVRNQELAAENRRLSEDRARFDERLRIIQEMNQPQPQAEPDENVDPITTIGYLKREIAGLKQSGQQMTEQQRQQIQERQLFNAASADARAFRAQTRDYDQAFNHWSQSRAAELQNYGVPDQQIPAILDREQLDIAAQCFQRGVSPAATLYNVAKQRGYRPGNGSASHDGGAAEQIERVATGQQRSQTLSGTGGGAAPTQMTAQRLLAMSNDEFDAWTTKNPAKTRALMGQEPKRGRG